MHLRPGRLTGGLRRSHAGVTHLTPHCELQAASYKPQATSRKLQAASHKQFEARA